MFSLAELSPQYGQEMLPHLMPHLFPLMNILLTGGLLNLLCVSLTLDHGPRDHKGSLFALARYILPSAALAAVSNIPKFLLMKTVHYEGLVAGELSLSMSSSSILFFRMWRVSPTELRLSRDHIYVILANTAITGLLPVLAWVIFISTSIKK